jgi:hypothetical protein
MTSSFALPPSVSFVMSLKNATEQNSRGCRRAKSITQAVGIKASVGADLLHTAIVAASMLVAPVTRTLARIARPPLRTVSSTSHAICMASTASIPTTSTARTQRIKHATTITTTTTLKDTPTTCTTMTATATVVMTSSSPPV